VVLAPEASALAAKCREIIAAVLPGYRTCPSMNAHLRRALAEGATLREVREGFEAAAIPDSFMMRHCALPFPIRIHEDIETGTFA